MEAREQALPEVGDAAPRRGGGGRHADDCSCRAGHARSLAASGRSKYAAAERGRLTLYKLRTGGRSRRQGVHDKIKI